jgi:RNA polymerase sigma factor (sigma-70 family)
MKESDTEFATLMERLRSGQDDAVRELHTRYGDHVLRVIRRRLDPRMRRQFDSADFAQAVWASFVAVPPEQFAFTDPPALVAYLAHMARNKVYEEARRKFGTQQHDLSRQEPLKSEHLELPHHATPSQILIADEQWDQLIQGLSPKVRRALELLRSGATHRVIARKLKINPRSVHRWLQRLQEKFKP